MSLPTHVPTQHSHRHFGVGAIVAGAALTAAACGGATGADPESTQNRLTETVPGVVDNAAGSMGLLTDSETLASVGQSFESLNGAFGFLGGGDDGTTGGQFRLFDSHDGGAIDEELSGSDVADFLNEHVFTEENYEGDGYYRLRGELFCPADVTTGTPDPQCVEQFDALELRMLAVLAGDNGVDISLVIGPDRLEPVSFELREDSLAVVADLGEIKRAVEFLAEATGEPVEGMPEVLEGVIAATLIVEGDEHVRVEGAVRQAIRVEAEDMSVSLAARDPMVALELDGPAQSVTASIDVGPFNLQGPWEQMNPESLATGAFELDWQGVSAEVTLQEGAKTLQIENVSFGDDTSTISLDGDVLFALDLNPDSGRSFTFTVLPEEGAHPLFGFDPELDLSLAFGMQPLADAGEEVPEFLLDETYRVAVTGEEPTIQPVDAAGEFTGGVRVVSGELSVSSTGADADVVVAEGNCLVEQAVAEGDHPVIGALAEGACE